MPAELNNQTRKYGFRTSPLTNVAGSVLGDWFTGCTFHQLERRIQSLFGEDVQEWGLLQLDGQCLL
jgi:hypothetical protein